MRHIRAGVCIVAIVCMLCIAWSASYSEELAGRIAGSTVPSASSLAVAGKGDSLKTETQIFKGTSTRGPFVLTWKQIEELSERVVVNGNLLQRDVHYQIDYSNGILAFNEPVPSGSVIRIEYQYNPARAVKNPSSLTIPLSLDLLKKRDSGVQLLGLYKQADTNNKAGSDLAVYGLSGITKGSQAELSLMFLFIPDRSGKSGAESPSFDDQSALKIGGSVDTKALKMTTSLLHVGEQFQGAQDYKLRRGLETMDLVASLMLSPALSFSSNVKRTAYSYGEKKGQAEASEIYSLVYNADKGPKINVTRTETEKVKPGAASVEARSDKVQIEQKVGANALATASHESVTTVTGGAQTSVDTSAVAIKYATTDTAVTSSFTRKETNNDSRESSLGIGIDRKLSKTLNISAAVVRSDSTKAGQVDTETIRFVGNPNTKFGYELLLAHKDAEMSGNEYSGGVKISAAPTSWLSAKAAVSHVDSESYGTTNSQSLNVAAKPSNLLNLEMSLARKDAAGADELAHNIKLVSALRQDLRLEFAMSGKDVEQSADEIARSAAVSTTMVKNTTIEMGWSEKESDVKGSEQSAGVRVVTSPTPTVKISGAVAQKEIGSSREVSTEARVDLSPYSHTKIAGGIKQSESSSGTVSRVTDISASTKPIEGLEFTGAYKMRDMTDKEDLESLNVALSLNASKRLALTAAYVSNPEDKNGAIQRLYSQSIGLKSDFGRLRLRSALSYKDEYVAEKRSQAMEFGLDYRLSANAMITTSYSLSEYQQGSLLDTEVYTLGYTHKVGTRLNLYLGGKLTTRTGDAISPDDSRNYEAEARLGIKF
ncbi:MAG: porin [Armatimonadetes bacterium]|nr:porin [Armatimonadota bacterium]